jgi:hypothetical protein
MTLQSIFDMLIVWFIVSIPASFFIAWFFSIRDCPDDVPHQETEPDILQPGSAVNRHIESSDQIDRTA